jgi:nucleoside-diphosphate-sugar epimerase
MTVLVTGAIGFIGAHLTRQLVVAGHRVIATGRQPMPPHELLKYAQYVMADLTQPAQLAALPQQVDAVIHVAALASDDKTWADFEMHNVQVTRLLAEKYCHVAYFILLSSSSVYNFSSGMPQRETDATESTANSHYGRSKYLSEQALLQTPAPAQHRLILRPRAVYGIGDRLLLPRLLQMVRGSFFISPGSMDVYTDLTHVQHITRTILQYLSQPTLFHDVILNIADFESYHLATIAIELLQTLYQRPLYHLPLPLLPLQLLASMQITNRLTPMALQSVTQTSLLDTSRWRAVVPPDMNLNLYHILPAWQRWLRGYDPTNPARAIQLYLARAAEAPWRLIL